jgi:glucose/arabinose dehydrogenase
VYSLRKYVARALVWLSLLAAVAGPAPQRWPITAAVRLDSLRLPAGFTIAVYADVPGARSMTLAPDGTVFVGSQGPLVHAVVDRDGDGRGDEVVVVADNLQLANGVAFRDGSLFVADLNRVLRYDGVLDFVHQAAAARTTRPKPEVILDGLPTDGYHGWRYLAFGPDGLLYVAVGAPCNVCEPGVPYASLLRMKPDGTGLEAVARGVRNSVGMDWDPQTNDLWFTDNGRDYLGDDAPSDELNHLSRLGEHFGFPYCHAGSIADPEFGRRRPCAQFSAPAQRLGPHVASIGMKFYAGEMFPPEYRNQILIAEHGSWNRTTPIGYRLSLVRLENGQPAKYETFVDGWLEGFRAWGRPVDLLVLPDGSLLVSDDTAGVIYRITYTKR